ncbi:hypothetical protein D9V41_09235 [Aeromicrobium phragmitis]|uniref:Uncharacterized protein n=1 Tax=Aeromicrobium phragmitis TaxID=2478914 RepID=A0A3L8PL56_9ACTN|nr:hypothetical protein D9V41_09235 [Aeromicrobium phragmitis]
MLIEHWSLIEADLHEVYGIDVDDRGLMRARSWRWLRTRIHALLDRPPQIAPNGAVVHSTRLGLILNPPKEPKEG